MAWIGGTGTGWRGWIGVAGVGVALAGVSACGNDKDGDGTDAVEVATTLAPQGEPETTTAPEVAVADAVRTTTTVPATTVIAVGTDMQGYSPIGYGPSFDYVGEPLATIIERTTDSGISVRVQQVPDWPGPTVGQTVPGAWSPAPWCNPLGPSRIAMTYGEAISVGQGMRYREPKDGVAASAFVAGYADGTPFTVVVAQVDATVAAVSAEFASGGTDTATPENGFAILAVPSAPDPLSSPDGQSWSVPLPPDYTLTVDRTDGTSTEISGLDLLAQQGGGEGWEEACAPPTELPDPGEQPTDPVAAEQAVRDAFAVVFEFRDRFGSGDRSWLPTLDSSEGVEAAIDEVLAGPYQDAAGTADYELHGVVFTSPTQAWFSYDLFANDNNFDDRFGTAYLIDGQWKISRAVLCQDLQLAGVTCQPAVAQLYPPQG